MHLRRGFVRILAFDDPGLLLVHCSDPSTQTGPTDSNAPGSHAENPEKQFDSKTAPWTSAKAFLTDQNLTVFHLVVNDMEEYEPT